MTENTIAPAWRKSTYSSGQNATCVEVADRSADLAVRDSKNPTGPTLAIAPTRWTAFLVSLRER